MQILDVVLKEDKQKLYAIGDSHANAVGKTSGFINFSTDGRSAFSQDNLTAIDQVEPGSIVVLSAGANDTWRDNKGAVVMRVEKLLNQLLAKDCEVYYILFGNLDSPNAFYRNNLRDEIRRQLPSGVNVLDMGQLKPNSPESKDGVHRIDGWYGAIAGQVKAKAGPNKVLNPRTQQPTQQTPASTAPTQSGQQPPGQSGQQAAPAPSQGSANKPRAAGAGVLSVDDAYSYLQSKSLDYKQIAGILNNIEHESGFVISSFNPNDAGSGRSIGLFQHHASRANDLERAVPDWKTNWKGQINFALSEPAGQKYQQMEFKNASQASAWWTVEFENPKYAMAKAISRLTTIKKYIRN